MHVEPGLLAAAKKAISAKPRKYVTPEILLAFVMAESGGVPYFVDHKPGSLFAANTFGACRYKKIDKKTGKVFRIETGMTPAEIRQWVTIPEKIGDFQVSKAMRGQLAKFRFEPSYWARTNRYYPDLSLEDKFIFSSSWGLVQFMAPNICKLPTPENLQFIRRWIADPDMQLVYAAGMVDSLLVTTKGNVHHSYRGYNSGDVNSTRTDTNQRADNVLRLLHDIEIQTGKIK